MPRFAARLQELASIARSQGYLTYDQVNAFLPDECTDSVHVEALLDVLDGLRITLVPAAHWSMREPWNRNDTLWGGYVVESADGTAYHSGDTAWGDHFAEIGKRFLIDWAMLPIGAYSASSSSTIGFTAAPIFGASGVTRSA